MEGQVIYSHELILNKIDELAAMVGEIHAHASSSMNKEKNRPLTKKEFAKRIGKSTSFVDQKRREGKLKWIRVGGSVRIPQSELSKYGLEV